MSAEHMVDTTTSTTGTTGTTSTPSTNLEAINNLSSLLNSGNMTVTNLTTTDKANIGGDINLTGNLNTIPFTTPWPPSQTALAKSKQAGITNDFNNHKTLMIVGNNSAGAERRVSVWDTLSVNGNANVTSDLNVSGNINNISFPPAWGQWPAGAIDRSKQAGISNDFGGFKTLMIVGNNSAGGERRVGVWDSLTVNGNNYVNGDLTVSGAINLGPWRFQQSGTQLSISHGGKQMMFLNNTGGGDVFQVKNSSRDANSYMFFNTANHVGNCTGGQCWTF